MKLRLLSFLGLVLCTLVSVQAQTTTNEVVFLNANKETIASNSTITVNTVEDSPFSVGQKQMSAELFISNTASDTRKVKLVYHIVEMEEGQLKVCTFGDCNSQNATGLYQLGPEEVENDEPIDLSVEHEFPANGKCKVILQIIVKEEAGDGTVVETAANHQLRASGHRHRLLTATDRRHLRCLQHPGRVAPQAALFALKPRQRRLYRKVQRQARNRLHAKVRRFLTRTPNTTQ